MKPLTITLIALSLLLALALLSFRKKTGDDAIYLEIGQLLFPAQKINFIAFFKAFEKDKKKFLSDNQTLLENYSDDGGAMLKAFDILYIFAEENGLAKTTDWRGEEDPKEIEKFLEKHLNRKISWTATEKLRTTVTDDHDGHFIIALFKALDQDLQALDQKLIFFD